MVVIFVYHLQWLVILLKWLTVIEDDGFCKREYTTFILVFVNLKK